MEGKRFSHKKMRNMRLLENMTQKRLANKLGVELEIVKAYESGRLVPGPNTINKMTVFLRCEEADLVEYRKEAEACQ